MKLNLDELRLYWIEQHKNSIISGNEHIALYISLFILIFIL